MPDELKKCGVFWCKVPDKSKVWFVFGVKCRTQSNYIAHIKNVFINFDTVFQEKCCRFHL